MRRLKAKSLKNGLPGSGKLVGLKELPQAPGVYFLRGRGRSGSVEYVGRSEDLRAHVPDELRLRLSTFSSSSSPLRSSISRSRPTRPGSSAELSELAYVVTGSVIEAELLELDLIRHYRPELNLRKNASRPAVYLHINSSSPFPTFEVSPRYPDHDKTGFGPFFEPDKLRRGLETARRILGLRYCTQPFPPPDYMRCVRFTRQHCAGPCRGMITPAVYRGRLDRLITFLRGADERLLEDTRRTYRSLSAEEASAFDEGARDLLEIQRGLLRLTEPSEGARLLVVTPPKGHGRVTMILFRRGRIIDRVRTHLDDARTERLTERLKSAMLAHQSDPVGLFRHEELSASRILRRHITSPGPGERVFPVQDAAELHRLLQLALRECGRDAQHSKL